MKSILKFAVAVLVTLCSFGAQAQNQGQYSKLWWNPNQSGMGTPISHQVQVNADGSKVDKIFGVWFHYGPSGDGAWLTFTCQSLSKDSLGRDTCTGQLARVRGPQPTVFNPNAVTVTTPGAFTITFNSSTSATFVYNFDNQAGNLSWEPQIFAVDSTALHYTDKVIAIWGPDAFPYLVTKNGVTKVVNKTQFQSGAFPVSDCALGPSMSDGKILHQCKIQVATNGYAAGALVVTYVNPNTGEMLDYTGTVPSNVNWLVSATNADKPEWGAKARVSDGWYYTTANATWVILFQSDDGKVTTVKAGTFAVDRNLRIMASYSN